MKKNKYKIAVLSDLKASARSTLKSTLSLAQMINADIDLFYVRKPTDVIEKENQLSAMRTINADYLKIDKKLQDLIKPLSMESGININYSFSFGNIKNEIAKFIGQSEPDIIVLGKRSAAPLKVMGDGITSFVLKKFNGVIMIAHNDNALEPNKEFSIGMLNTPEHIFNAAFIEDLINQSSKPLKSFKTTKDENNSLEEDTLAGKKIIEYVFEKGDHALNNISNYLSKSKIDLLFLDRPSHSSPDAGLKSLINNFNVTLLLLNGQKYNV